MICRDGAQCTVSCKSNACSDFTYICLTGATCNISPSGCLMDNSVTDVNGIICPTFTDTDTIVVTSKDKDDDQELMDKYGVIIPDQIETDTALGDCEAKQECVGGVINDATGFSRCDGEESCKSATILTGIQCRASRSCVLSVIDTNDNFNDECGGFQSCFKSDINATTSTTGEVECDGPSSCAQSEIVAETIVCSGKLSCADSVNINGAQLVAVGGYFAAARSTIYSSWVYILAYKGLFLSTVDSMGRDTMIVEAYGHLSGDSASVICRSGSECSIKCVSTGCKNMDYICENGAICNIEPSECDGSRNMYKGTDCPIRTNNVAADEYMDKKYEMNRDIYDAFDEFIDNFVVNYDHDLDDGEYDAQEMIFTNDDIGFFKENVKGYNTEAVVIMVLFIMVGLCASFMIFSWCRDRNLKNEYQSI